MTQNRLDATEGGTDNVLVRRMRGNLCTQWKGTLRTHSVATHGASYRTASPNLTLAFIVVSVFMGPY